MNHIVDILSIGLITHDTLSIITERPPAYSFSPGQGTWIAINKNGLSEDKRPFSFASAPDDEKIEFIIKVYPGHDGTTDRMLHMQTGDKLILHDVFGSIGYRGKGLFIAGGAGVTPFLSIFRDLDKQQMLKGNKLLYFNKTIRDIILHKEINRMFNSDVTHILSEEHQSGYAYGLVSEPAIASQLEPNDFVYLCGPQGMMRMAEQQLSSLGVPPARIVKESW